MLHGEILIPHLLGLFLCLRQRPIGVTRQIALGITCRLGLPLDRLGNPSFEIIQIDLHLNQYIENQTIGSIDQPHDKVLLIDCRIAIFLCQHTRLIDCLNRIFRHFIHIHLTHLFILNILSMHQIEPLKQ